MPVAGRSGWSFSSANSGHAAQLAARDGRDGHDQRLYRIAADVFQGSMRALLQAVGNGTLVPAVRKTLKAEMDALTLGRDTKRIRELQELIALCV